MISISRPATGKDFVNRKEILKRLNNAYQRHNIALVGPRRIGKSSIVEKFLSTIANRNIVTIVFDVSSNMGTPGRFAIRLLISYLDSYLKFRREDEDISVLLEDMDIKPANLMELAERLNSNALKKLSQFLIAYYPPSVENEQEVLKRIFNFLENFAEEKGFEIALALDEFQTITDLNRFAGFKDISVLAFLQGIISLQKRVWYLFTGSSVRLMTEILEDSASPFYGRVIRINVGGFTKEDTVELINKVSEKSYSGEAIKFLWHITRGNPYYVVVLSVCSNTLAEGKNYINKEIVEEAFIEEITKGSIYSHCQYIFDTSLGRTQKKTERATSVLKEVMRILSSGIKSPSGLAKRLGRPASYVSPLLGNLYQLDLIEKVGKSYFISDFVLQSWIENVYGANLPRVDNIRRRLSQDYREYIEKLKKDTGYFFESYMREMLGKFNQTAFKDRILPRFDEVVCLNIFDKTGKVFGRESNIEIDALCRGKVNWLCEFRYKNEPAAKRDIDLLIRKRHLIESELNLKIERLMFISRAGFTEAALNEDVWCLDAKKINELLSRLDMRKI